MKLSKEYITIRLAGNTTVRELAEEIAKEAAKKYPDHVVNMDASIAKFERMLQPFAPKENA